MRRNRLEISIRYDSRVIVVYRRLQLNLEFGSGVVGSRALYRAALSRRAPYSSVVGDSFKVSDRVKHHRQLIILILIELLCR